MEKDGPGDGDHKIAPSTQSYGSVYETAFLH